MKNARKPIRLFLLLICLALPAVCQTRNTRVPASQSTGVLITNDDLSGTSANSATFYTIAADGTLSSPTSLSVGGHGAGGGFFAANRVTILNTATSSCAYFSAGLSNTIAGVQLQTNTVAGDFSASATDLGADNGVGMVMNSSYLYASFSSSGTIATFAVLPECALQFLADIVPDGLNGGVPKGMAVSGNLLIVTYGDGSIQSFDISGGVPVAHSDEQNSTGYATDNFPDSVVITPDGHYAIFGDDSSGAAVETSDISSGQLAPTVLYNLPWSGFNSNNVLLSPDATLLYIVNNTSGQVSAAFFDAATGAVSQGCLSAELNGFDSTFSFLSGPVTQLASGTGSVLYVPEFGDPSAIAVINVTSGGGQCTLTEAAGSPVIDPNSINLLSIAVVQNVQPGLYNPTPGSTLAGNSATFQWYGPSGASAFWIDIGSNAGGNQYYQSGSLPTTTLSATVNSLPTDGSTVYVTLYWLIAGSWVSNPYTFTASGGSGTKGIITSPVSGTTLTGSSVTFTWSAGSSATAYWIDIGNVAGGNQYWQSGNLGNVLSETASGLPTNGSAVYVTLYSLVSGQWLSNAYTYTAFNASAAGAVMSTPVPGSTLAGSSATFTWTAGGSASAYWLDVGSNPGGNQYFQSGNLGNVLSTTVNSLPTDGSTVYATLYSLIGGQWVANAYTYTAFNASGTLAVMQTPVPGSTLSGSSATFTWSSDSSATAYWLDIGTVAGGNTIFQSGNLGNVLTIKVNSLPANGSTIYTTLYSLVGGQWSNTSATYVSGP